MIKTKNLHITICILILALLSSVRCNKDNSQDNGYTLRLLSESQLPNTLKECSGIEIIGKNELWMQNDAGNDPMLYAIDSIGQLIKSIELTGVENQDWEDLTQDDAGNLYVGDFGNNDNDRNDLAIFVISSPGEITTSSYTPEIIHFSFEDQSEFPPEKNAHFFDTEGFFTADGNIYLFIKDRSKPFIGLTNLYELPAQPGTQIAKKIASFDTEDKKSEGAITSADISPDGTKVALLTHDIVWLFTEFIAPQYLSGTVEKLYIPIDHQFEGIAFKDNCSILVTSERKDDGGSQLFNFNLCR